MNESKKVVPVIDVEDELVAAQQDLSKVPAFCRAVAEKLRAAFCENEREFRAEMLAAEFAIFADDIESGGDCDSEYFDQLLELLQDECALGGVQLRAGLNSTN